MVISRESLTQSSPPPVHIEEKEVDTGDDSSTQISPSGSSEEHGVVSSFSPDVDVSFGESSISIKTDIDGPRESYRTTMLSPCVSVEEPGNDFLLLPSTMRRDTNTERADERKEENESVSELIQLSSSNNAGVPQMDTINESRSAPSPAAIALGSPGETSTQSAPTPPSQTFAVATRSLLRRLEESYKTNRSSSPTNTDTNHNTELNSATVAVSVESRTDVNSVPLVLPVGGGESSCSQEVEERTTKMPPVMLRMPNTAFGIGMGLAGNAIMWRTACDAQFIADRIDTSAANKFFWIAGIVAAMAVAVAYVYKVITAFELVKQEYLNPVRIHFMNGPNLTLLMLTLGVPEDVGVDIMTLRIIWGIGFLAQIIITQFVYEKWMFSTTCNISVARPQFLLSTVGWFLLCVLGQKSGIEESWGLALPAFCLGAGTVLYLLVITSIFGRLHKDRASKGAPSLTLMIAPPAVGVVAIDGFDSHPDEFSVLAEMVLGWCLALVLLLFKLGPKISKRPKVLGVYWAYVFPLSALGNACIRYGDVRGSPASEVMASVFMGLSVFALAVVFVRMSYHIWECCKNQTDWDDPLVKRYEPDEMPSDHTMHAVPGRHDVESAESPVTTNTPGTSS